MFAPSLDQATKYAIISNILIWCIKILVTFIMSLANKPRDIYVQFFLSIGDDRMPSNIALCWCFFKLTTSGSNLGHFHETACPKPRLSMIFYGVKYGYKYFNLVCKNPFDIHNAVCTQVEGHPKLKLFDLQVMTLCSCTQLCVGAPLSSQI